MLKFLIDRLKFFAVSSSPKY